MSIAGDKERSNLFLIRLWTTGAHQGLGGYSSSGPQSDAAHPPWEGRFLNVLNGEGHNFSSLTGLVAILEQILTPSSSHILHDPGPDPNHATSGK
jgi:hypothetical protein